MMMGRGKLLRGHALIDSMAGHCRFQVVPLRKTGIHGVFGFQAQGGVLLASGVFHFPLHGQFDVPEGLGLYVHVHGTPPEGSAFGGVPLPPHAVFRATAASPGVDVTFGANARVSLLLLPQQREWLGVVPEESESPRRRLSRDLVELRPESPLTAHYEYLYEWLIGIKGSVSPSSFEWRAVGATLESCFRGEYLPWHDEACVSSYSHRVHYVTFRRAVQFMRQHFQRDIYMDELAAECRVSARSVRYAFEHAVGLSPNRYLSALRLCEAHRRLSSFGARFGSVKAVALECGFWNTSRFASGYRSMFGENPSDTVARLCRSAA
jgi:AraC family ethanolamine operon transcriptional activator